MTTKMIRAVYQDGVLKPTTELDLPENTTVNLILTSPPVQPTEGGPRPFASLQGIWSEAQFPDSIELILKQIREQSAVRLEQLARELSAE